MHLVAVIKTDSLINMFKTFLFQKNLKTYNFRHRQARPITLCTDFHSTGHLNKVGAVK